MMEGSKGGGGGGGDGRVGVGDDDLGDGMQCINHPYRNDPRAICAFCLQEKLGKLVSSSFPLPIRPSLSSSSSSPPPFTSDSGGNGGGGASVSSLSVVRPISTRNDNTTGHYEECYTRKARIPFLLAKKKNKKMMDESSGHPYHHHHHHDANIVFKRSKSTAAPIRGRFLDGDNGGDFIPRKRSGFWSFLNLSSKTHGSKKLDKVSSVGTPLATSSAVAIVAAGGASSSGPKDKSVGSSRKAGIVVIEDDDSPSNEATPSTGSSFERKVSRSRSVGCGSRSFSGDFFERISTGFGDCTLRRVESQREGKPNISTASVGAPSAMKERVKCGGIFGGFIITSSSSSYWVSSSTEDQNVNGRSSKSWGWAFASPIRAFTKPSSGKKSNTTVIRESNKKNTAPNLSAIPSLLAVRT
ncbi:bidirectional sugar transporter SWEET17-like [Hibiscus syriacus]|uniref:Bidirectional sugar transporter SWEET17-like n=1 Tax=Hibiscus syriacus TaxID=106335 RepID=A0A6A3B574_HIBSY|nr:uncharacterized protein LOC120115702 [Hibiscus syriacus]KAE8711926.1 bidirectional sugar transporter SWEET17-like [Hibiscus syriacus]